MAHVKGFPDRFYLIEASYDVSKRNSETRETVSRFVCTSLPFGKNESDGEEIAINILIDDVKKVHEKFSPDAEEIHILNIDYKIKSMGRPLLGGGFCFSIHGV